MDKKYNFFTLLEGFLPDFQSEIFTSLAEIIKRGESVQMVGISGSGTSLVYKLILQFDSIREKYFNHKDRYRFVYIDSDKLLEKNSFSLTRMLLSELGVGVSNSEDQLAAVQEMGELIDELCAKEKLVIIFDRIDDLSSDKCRIFFDNLAELHRNYESRMCFVFSTHQPMTEKKELENFGALATVMVTNFLYVPLMSKKDSFWFIGERARQLNFGLNRSQKENIYKLAGGFPRTMRRIVEAVHRGHTLADIDSDPTCDHALALHLQDLVLHSEYAEKIPILKIYLASQAKDQSSEVVGDVRLDSRLTKNELKVLKILAENMGEIMSREEMIEKVWGKNALDISDHAYDQIVHRLRGKLAGSTPRVKLETVRGRGHCLRVMS